MQGQCCASPAVHEKCQCSALSAVSMWCVPLSHPGNGEFITVVFGQDFLRAEQGGEASQKITAQDGTTGILCLTGNALL